MLNLTIRRSDAPGYRTATIQFPALENELQDQLNRIGIGITTDKSCLVEEISGEENALQGMVGQCVNADEVQYLAKRMEHFDKNETQKFFAAASVIKQPTIKDLINLTFHMSSYWLISDFSDISEIGRSHELSRRSEMSRKEIKETDFTEIGRRFVREENGIVTPYGVLYSTGGKQEQVYNGEQFPEYSYRGKDVAVVTLEAGSYSEGIRYEYVYLPCWDVEIQKAVCRLGVENIHSCVTTLDCDVMSEYVYHIFTEDYPLSEHIDALNDLTRVYPGLYHEGLAAFHAIVDMVQPKTPEEVAMLADNFYEFIAAAGVRTPSEYGRYMIMDSQRYEFDKSLEEYMDFKSYGERRIQEEGGCFTDYGYIAYKGTAPAVLELLGRNDVPGMGMGGME